MQQDISTVIWKERKSLFQQSGSRKRFVLAVVTPVLMIGIALPAQFGPHFLDSGWSLVASFIIPILLVGISVPAAFAGEREQHTLETLLASRLPDRAILLGKLGLSVAYGWSISLLLLLFSLVPANVFHWEGHVMFFRLDVLLVNALVSLLTSGFMAGLGILISLRATTAQSAQQTLMGTLLVPLALLQLVPMLVLSLIPDGGERLEELLKAAGKPAFIATVLAVWLLIDLALLWAATIRFQRSRLILY